MVRTGRTPSTDELRRRGALLLTRALLEDSLSAMSEFIRFLTTYGPLLEGEAA